MFNFKKWFKKKEIVNKNSDDFIFVPLSVSNDSNYDKSNPNNKFLRILKTKHFQITKKIKHPSGTTIIRAEDYAILKQNHEKESKNNENKSLINYKAPSSAILKRAPKAKTPWRY